MIPGKYPPGPRGHPLWGISRQLQRDLLGTMTSLTHEFGDAVRFRFLPGHYAYLFTHPDHVHHILHQYANIYSKDVPAFKMLRKFEGNGLVTSEGDLWRHQRKLMQPAFHRQHIAKLAGVMTDATTRLANRWSQRLDNQPLDIHREMTRLTLEIAGLTLFGIDISADGDCVGQGVEALSNFVSKASVNPRYFWMINWPLRRNVRIQAQMKASHEVVDRIIRQRRKNPVPEANDLLALLMEARDEEIGETMPDEQIRAEVHTLLNAGHDTSANALTWLFYLLSIHPEIMAKVEKEQNLVLAGQRPTLEALFRLSYSKMVIEETLRLYPPVYGTVRKAEQRDVVKGFRVEPNSIIAIYPYLTHRHPDFWPEPESFFPERFAENSSINRHKYAYIPFGAGPRQCIAANFAMMEMQLVLATLLSRFTFKPVPGHSVKLEPLVTLRPKGGLPLLVQRRS